MTHEPITAQSMASQYAAMMMLNGRRFRGAVEQRTAKQIIADIAAANGITPSELMGNCRERKFSWPRQEAMHAMRNELDMPLPQIGRIMNRDHTTVIHGIERVQARAKRALL